MKTELNKIEISINKAVIKTIAFHCAKDNDIPEVAINIDLMSVGGNKIADVSLATNSWNDNTKLVQGDIPVEVYNLIGKIASLLSPVCIRRINSIDKLLK